jgi:hypothetical protein
MQIAIVSALQGLGQAQTRLTAAAAQIANPSDTGDQVSLTEAAVSLLQAKNDFQLDLNVVKVADDLEKSLISLQG